jgi:uncharacterized repeat protein (TIGR02543 family)
MRERLQEKWCPASKRRMAWKTGLRAAPMLLFTAALIMALSGCPNTVDTNPSFVAVTDVSGVPALGTAGTEIDLSAAKVVPTNATNQAISWELVQDNGTGVSAQNVASGKFTPSTAGSLIVKAVVDNGTAEGVPYARQFTIVIAPAGNEGGPTGYIATANGKNNEETSTAITITFAADISGLTSADVSVGKTGDTASVVKGDLTGSGKTWTLAITVNTAGVVTVSINKAGIISSETTVAVHKTGEDMPLALTGSVTVGGTLHEGQTLTANTAALGGSGTITYKWQRSDTADGTFADISGAASGTYILAEADLDKFIRLAVSREGYDGTITSEPVGPVAADPSQTRYTITFESHGGTVVAAITKNAGTVVAKPEDPTREGYTFTGWFSAETGGTKYTWPHAVNENIIVHAHWRDSTLPMPAQNTITFESHDGTEVTAITEDEGTVVAKPLDPTRRGYTFTGWFSAETGGTKYTWPHAVNETITMHAQWTLVSYTITYNLDGGTNPETSNPPESSYTVVSSEITLPTPTKDNYTFGGWFTDRNFSSQVVTKIAEGSTGNKAFWAKWIQGEAGITISYWVNQQDQISSNAASATVSKSGDPLIIAADGEGYSDQQWYVNGVEDVSKAGELFYSFSGKGKDNKIYTIVLRVKKDEQYYSTQFAVTVTE